MTQWNWAVPNVIFGRIEWRARHFWRLKKITEYRFRCAKYFEISFTWQRFEPGLANYPLDSSSRPTWWLLVANTAPRSLLNSYYSSKAGNKASQRKNGFLYRMLVFLPLLPRKRLLKNHAACCSLAAEDRVCLTSYSFSTTTFVNAYLWAVRPLSLKFFK